MFSVLCRLLFSVFKFEVESDEAESGGEHDEALAGDEDNEHSDSDEEDEPEFALPSLLFALSDCWLFELGVELFVL